jgi:uncharacterized protein YqhQ
MPEGEYLQYGGQAIVEGVMMRSPRYFAVACRAPNGEIITHVEPLEKTWIGRQKWLKWPFFRGSLALIDAMALGIKSLRFASNIQLDEAYAAPVEGEADKLTSKTADADKSKKIQEAQVAGAMVFGLGFGFFLFNFLPNLLAEQSKRAGVQSGTLINFITEIIKVTFFLGYIWLIGRLPEMKRVFQYHGAEHKAINTLEAIQELNMDNCRAQTRLHPRCGTSFAIVVLIVSMALFTFIPRYPLGQDHAMILNVIIRVALELLILPIISGIAYELIRIAGKFRNAAIIDALFKPGLMTQYLTTNEPDDSQIEVALAALQLVVDAEKNDAVTKTVMSDPELSVA